MIWIATDATETIATDATETIATDATETMRDRRDGYDRDRKDAPEDRYSRFQERDFEREKMARSRSSDNWEQQRGRERERTTGGNDYRPLSANSRQDGRLYRERDFEREQRDYRERKGVRPGHHGVQSSRGGSSSVDGKEFREREFAREKEDYQLRSKSHSRDRSSRDRDVERGSEREGRYAFREREFEREKREYSRESSSSRSRDDRGIRSPNQLM